MQKFERNLIVAYTGCFYIVIYEIKEKSYSDL